MNFVSEVLLNSEAFWVFVGVLAGAGIQHVLAILQHRRQARTALKVMQIEIAHNQSRVVSLIDHLKRLKERIASNQVDEKDLFVPMHRFDYSSLGPLNNSGYFHLFLGAKRLQDYLEYTYFFNKENGHFLTDLLRERHAEGKSMQLLDDIISDASRISMKMQVIENGRLSPLSLTLQ